VTPPVFQDEKDEAFKVGLTLHERKKELEASLTNSSRSCFISLFCSLVALQGLMKGKS